MGKVIKLVLVNFKSYKGTQTIGPFIDNYTSIIGPNGSGKSNLVDAVSFVFGISSVHIRSTGLGDLVYKFKDETEKKKKGETSVSLYFEALGEEIVFTRSILFSSNSSEYKLNGKKISYGEYTKILEKHNILLKARNFFVFQGDVESVALKSPREITELIEQICGSDSFKGEYETKKEAYLLSMEDTSAVVGKKKDINIEMKLLKEQKEALVKAGALRDELNHLTQKCFLYQLFHIEQKAKNLFIEIDGKKEQLISLKKKINETTEKKEILQRRKEDAFKENLKKEKNTLSIEKELREKTNEMEFVVEREKETISKNESTKKTHQEIVDEIEQQKKEEKVLRNELKNVKDAEKSLEIRKKARTKLTKKQEEEYFRLQEKTAEETLGLQADLKESEKMLSPFLKQEKENKETREGLLDRKEVLLSEKERAEKALSSVREKVKETKNRLDREESSLQLIKERKEAGLVEEKRLKERLLELNERLSDAKTHQKTTEREQTMRETISKIKSMFSGVHGRVSDLFRPTSKKYETALCIAIGKNLNAIVVDQERTAIRCIEYLKEQRIGQESFIPLDTIVTYPIDERLRTKKNARPVFDVLKVDSSFVRAALYVCGNSLVCDDLDTARTLCFEEDISAKVISLDGSVISRNGFITGGVLRETRVFEKKEIELAKEEKAEIVRRIENAVRQNRIDVSENEQRISSLSAHLSFLGEDVTVLEKKRNEKDVELLYIEEEFERLSKKNDQIEKQSKKIKEKIRVIRGEILRIEKTVFRLFYAETGISDLSEEDELQRKTAEKKTELASLISRLESSIDYEVQRISDLEIIGRSLKEKLAEESAALKTLKQRKKELEKETEKVERKKKKELEEVACAAKSGSIEQELGSVDEEIKENNHALRRLNREVSTTGLMVESSIQERGEMLKRCKMEGVVLPLSKGRWCDSEIDQKISLDFKTIEEELKESFQTSIVARYEQQKTEVKERISSLSVFFRSSNKIESAEQRLNQLAEEVETTKKERKQIKEEYFEIREKRRSCFEKALNHISVHIDSIYKELTKSKMFPDGGSAYLTPEDNEEPYLAGLRYHVMPPMKRFREIEQLSGGEKTIAAISLLFSIHSYKPAPFFILDEIDAALDNVNGNRLSSFIRMHSEKNGTQFIIISLKPGFYSKADSLVGIYRDNQEKASKALTLSLRQLDL